MTYGERVKQARELWGLTQKDLATRLGVTQSTIAQIETERIAPSSHLLKLLAEETQVRPRFFERSPLADFPLGSLAYRARVALKAHERDRAYQCAKLYVEQLRAMVTQLELPDLVLPKAIEKPEQSARLTRVAFGLSPDQPLFNLVNNLERHGVIVLALPFELGKLDAFSTWVVLDHEHPDEERPLIALSSGKPGDRLRFSVAHELGHVVMHKGLHGRFALFEQEANQFAAELLLPESAMRSMIHDPLTLTYAARIKLRWGVSIQAIIRRARDLGLITDRRYRYLAEQIGRKGWRIREPSNLDIPVEKPRGFKQMTELVYGPLQENERLADATDILPSFGQFMLRHYASALSVPYPSETEEYQYLPGKESLS